MRLHYYEVSEYMPEEVLKEYDIEVEEIVSIISLSTAKKFLKLYGGKAWARHIDRDGGCFEVTNITVKGNNSKFKYSQHL